MISSLVQQIQAKRDALAPQIKLLREKRKKFQELEHEYTEKKSIYDNTKIGFESECSKLRQEVEALQEDIERSETIFHDFTCQILLGELRLRRRMFIFKTYRISWRRIKV